MKAAVERFVALPPSRRRVVHELLVEQALARWEAYAAGRGSIRYRDSVAGTVQRVDARLPADAVAAVRSGRNAAALQDGDLALPEAVTFAYYAIYNCFRKYSLGEECDDLTLLNQAGSSEEDESRWEGALLESVERAMRTPATRE